MHQIRQALVRLRLGATDREIAREGGIGRKKVAEIRRQAEGRGWLDPGWPLPEDAELAEVFKARQATHPTTSRVEPYREEVEAWHRSGIQGTTIHQALVRKHGFTGSYMSVYRFLKSLGPEPSCTVILEFAPGEAAQVDFGAGPKIVDRQTGEVVSTWIFVMTLCFSRHAYAEFVRNQKVETWLVCHRHAFEWFNGVVGKVILDNAKCAITRACFREPEVQRSYGDLAEGYAFQISACPPRTPQLKGRVESGVKYVKNAFVPLREFRDLHDANEQLRAWLLGEAGNRIHGTTRQRPLTLFRETEQAILKPLPDIAPELPVWGRASVHGNAHVQHEKALYSVPYRLMGNSLWLRVTASTVQIFKDQEMVAIHPRLLRPGARSTVDDHLPPDAKAYFMRDPQWCLRQAKAVGPSCFALVQCLFAHRVLDNLRAAQGVVRFADTHGKVRLEAACQRALAFESPYYRTVKQILQAGTDAQPALATLEELPAAYTGGGRFTRDGGDLLH